MAFCLAARVFSLLWQLVASCLQRVAVREAELQVELQEDYDQRLREERRQWERQASTEVGRSGRHTQGHSRGLMGFCF